MINIVVSFLWQLKLNPFTRTQASIGACEKAAKWQLAASLFGELNARQLQPTVISYSAMISACQKAGQWQLALHFFSEMPRAEVSPNVISSWHPDKALFVCG